MERGGRVEENSARVFPGARNNEVFGNGRKARADNHRCGTMAGRKGVK